KLKGLAVASEKRIAIMPAVPTYAESGFPGFTASSWVGFFAPAKTPRDVIGKLHEAIDTIVQEADTQQRLAALGYEPINGTQNQAQMMFQTEVAKWSTMVTALNLTG